MRSVSQTGSWSVAQGAGTFSDPNSPVSPVSDLSAGTNQIVWTVVNGACSVADELVITILNFPDARGVSPNGDGVNDVLILPGLKDFPNTRLSIYTRWGSLVWHSDNYQEDWGGTNQEGQELPDDTYYYLLELESGNQYKGFIHLKR